MKQRIVTGVLFTLAVALFIIPGFWLPLVPILLFAAVALIASWEMVNALRQKGMKPSLPLTMSGSMAMLLPLLVMVLSGSRQTFSIAGCQNGPLITGFAAMFLALLILMGCSVIGLIIRRGPDALPDAVATAVLMGYIAFPTSCPGMLLFNFNGGWLWMVVGLATPWISDVFAYFTGTVIGRHPIVRSISPKKTLEGCLGGIAGSVLVTLLIFRIFGYLLDGTPEPGWQYLLFFGLAGLLLSVAAQLGDWLASGIKRWCGVKDFGKILPGHGGIMDRFDSAFFTLPMTLVLATFYQGILA